MAQLRPTALPEYLKSRAYITLIFGRYVGGEFTLWGEFTLPATYPVRPVAALAEFTLEVEYETRTISYPWP